MGFMQRGSVVDKLHAAHAFVNNFAIEDRAHQVREGRFLYIQPNDFMTCLEQAAHKRLTEVTGTACDQDFHNNAI
jgi:hypothetical protein